MATMTKHAQGVFCWPELSTPDMDLGKKFYGSLFGWTFKDTPMPPEAGGGIYTIFQLGGRDVAAMTPLGAEMKKNGVPPNWGAYIAVDDADAVVNKAKELGGTVVMGPFDVMGTYGRMATIVDPTGAVFNIWQAGTHNGVQVRDEPNALSWNELMTRDAARAKTFYSELIGYQPQPMPMGEFEYTVIADSAGVGRGGIMPILPRMGAMPSHWLTYFASADIRKAVQQAKGLGAKVHMDVTPIPNVGEFAVLEDPMGAPFALLQPKM